MSSSDSKRTMHCKSIAFTSVHKLSKFTIYNKELKLR